MHCLQKPTIHRLAIAIAAIVGLLAGSEGRIGLASSVDFERDIRPLLRTHCLKCHGPEKQKGGLRLDVKAAALAGGDSGQPAIVPGDIEQSHLLPLVASKEETERMPPEGPPLSPAEIELLRRWIEAGAAWPESATAPRTSRSEMVVTDEDRQHWAFRPLELVAPPAVQDQDWVKTPVDQFIRHALETGGLRPTAALDARRLVRRLYFDVIGLPPILREQDGKLEEDRLSIEIKLSSSHLHPADVEAVVDKLLASPHYGERWSRHWLDVARYADSDGQESDGDRPNAYHFRDFVIRSLNEDLPYNTFVRWQLAGDEIAPDNPMAIAATGFIVAGNSTELNVPMEEEKLRNRANELDDMVSTTGQALLGLTLACARCHDHKYDPLPTRDYYRIMCAFNGGDRREVPLAAPEVAAANHAAMALWQKEFSAAEAERDQWLESARKLVMAQVLGPKVAKLPISDAQRQLLLASSDDAEAKKLADRFKKELKTADSEYVAALPSPEQMHWKKLDDAVKAVAARKPKALPVAFAFADFASEPRETWFFERGDFMARNERMQLGFLSVLMRGKTAEDYWKTARQSPLRSDSTQQRRAMAQWITDVDHGAGALLARVMVNRLWQHHFGEGIVRTVSDFGTRGESPSHPELLEWLAGELVRSDWSLKHVHRLILNSATYQQGIALDEAQAKVDPENRLLWRRRPLRLEAEVLRDSMLAVAGSLSDAMYGPSFKPPIAAEAMQARNVKQPYPRDAKDAPETRRRSVYLFHKRVVQYPLMQAFDAPDAQVSCSRRLNTTVAPQALALLNDPFIRLRASELAERLVSETGKDIKLQLGRAFQLAFGRAAACDELADAARFVDEQTAARRQRDAELTADAAQQLAVTDFCQMLFASNEFIYVD